MTRCLKIFPGTLRAFSRVWARDFAGASPGPVAGRDAVPRSGWHFAIDLRRRKYPEINISRASFAKSPAKRKQGYQVRLRVFRNVYKYTEERTSFPSIIAAKSNGENFEGGEKCKLGMFSLKVLFLFSMRLSFFFSFFKHPFRKIWSILASLDLYFIS